LSGGAIRRRSGY